MPLSLLESIQYWSDIQSILTRTTEQDISFKYPLARKMLSAAVGLYRWYRQRNLAPKWLGLVPVHNALTAANLNSSMMMGGGGLSTGIGILEADEVDGFEVTDVGAEEGSDADLDVVPADPDTETEFPAGDDNLVDSDAEEGGGGGGGGGGGNHHNFMGAV
jgi:hypothetical protein